MTHRNTWIVGIVVAGLSVPAWADRALGPSDTLEAGTVELGVSVSSQRRVLSLDDLAGATDVTSRSADTELSARAWLSDSWWLAASQAAFFARSAEDNFGELPIVDEQGLSVLAVSGGGLGRIGSLELGGSMALSLPNGSGFNLGRVDATARAIAALPGFSGGEVFVLADYTARFGDSFTDVPDSVTSTLGYHQRLGNLSLLTGASVERLLTRTAEEDAFSTLRGSLVAGYEVADDVTIVARLEAGWALAHEVGQTARGSARELTAATALVYAWDLRPLASRSTAAPDPATIRVSDVDGGESVEQALRTRVPALRLATLKAERKAGGANGTMRVTIELGRDGRVESTDVIDGTGVQNLADAVEKYWRGIELSELVQPPRSVTFTLAFARPEDTP